ncbi:MAG: serine hydrolase [Spirosomataceae bacterium]
MNRRTFIQNSSASTLGLGMLPWLDTFGMGTDRLPRRSPESQGVFSAGIRNFLKAIKESGLEWHSFMLVRHGNVVAEGWWKPFEASYKHTLYSLSKSFTSTAVGFLVNEGKISVEDQVLKFFPDETPALPSVNLKAMKIRHLLTMNTGHHTDSMPDLRAKPEQSWVKSFLEKSVEHEPGSFFMYNTGATYMLGAIVSKVTGQLLEDYLAPRLFQPLGIEGYDWEKSPQGLNTAGYGLRVKTEDIAKFGQFYLQKGKWNGKQLLSETWINEATQKQTTSQTGDNDWSQGYGYQFWRCKPGFYRGDGAYGQFCMVMPEHDAVLAMTSESWDLQKSMNVAYQTILPALTKGTLAENPTELSALQAELSALTLPIPKGATHSAIQAQYSDKMFNVEKNSYGISKIGFGLFDDAGVLRVSTEGNSFKKIGFGWEQWKVGKNGEKRNFFVPTGGNQPVPSTLAATGTWTNENTLQINIKYVEAIHGDKLTCVFDGNKVTISFTSSIAENPKNQPDKREQLKGTLLL